MRVGGAALRLIVCLVLLQIPTSAFWLLGNLYLQNLGYSPSQIGLWISVQTLGGILTALPLAAWGQRLPYALLLAGSTVAYVLSAAIGLLFARQPTVLFASGFVLGASFAIWFAVQAPFLTALTPRGAREITFALFHGSTILSGFAASLAAGALSTALQRRLPPATAQLLVLLGSFTVGLLLLPLLLRLPGRPPSERPAPPWREHGRNLFLLSVPALIIGAGAGMLVPFWNLYFRNVFQLSDATIGTIFGIGTLTLALGHYLAGPMGRRWGRLPVIVWTQYASLPLLLALAHTQNASLAGFLYITRNALMNLAWPLWNLLQMEAFPGNQRLMVSAFLGVMFQLGWLLGPPVSGILQEKVGFSLVFYAVLVLYFLGTLWAQLLLRELPSAR